MVPQSSVGWVGGVLAGGWFLANIIIIFVCYVFSFFVSDDDT
jgi:hypothetical protein